MGAQGKSNHHNPPSQPTMPKSQWGGWLKSFSKPTGRRAGRANSSGGWDNTFRGPGSAVKPVGWSNTGTLHLEKGEAEPLPRFPSAVSGDYPSRLFPQLGGLHVKRENRSEDELTKEAHVMIEDMLHAVEKAPKQRGLLDIQVKSDRELDSCSAWLGAVAFHMVNAVEKSITLEAQLSKQENMRDLKTLGRKILAGVPLAEEMTAEEIEAKAIQEDEGGEGDFEHRELLEEDLMEFCQGVGPQLLEISKLPEEKLRAMLSLARDGLDVSGMSWKEVTLGIVGVVFEEEEDARLLYRFLEWMEREEENRVLVEHLHAQGRVGKYTVRRVLGMGASSVVLHAVDEETRLPRALKCISKIRLSRDFLLRSRMERELAIGHKLGLRHPNVVRYAPPVDGGKCVCLPMDMCSGGELYDYVRAASAEEEGKGVQKALSEKEALRLFVQLVGAVDYLHKHRVVHGDLKLENLLMDASGHLRITDFGFASYCPQSNFQVYSSCGSPDYAAPELFEASKEHDGRKSDVWACGVILHLMLQGDFPFPPVKDEHGPAVQDYTPPTNTSVDVQHLLSHIFNPDPAKRMSTTDVLGHVVCEEFQLEQRRGIRL